MSILLLSFYALCHSVKGLLTTQGLPYMGKYRESVDPREAAQFRSIALIRAAKVELAQLRTPGVLSIDARLSLAHTVLHSRSIGGTNIAAGGLASFSGNAGGLFCPDIDEW